MNWLDRVSLNLAAKKYARRLPGELRRCWGADKTYTPGQIGTGIAALKLPARWAVLGYAAFLDATDFAASTALFPVVLPYGLARTCFERFVIRPKGNGYVFETTGASDLSIGP